MKRFFNRTGLASIIGVLLLMSLGLSLISPQVARAVSLPRLFAWGHQFGVSGYDEARGVAVDGAGNAYVVGWTSGVLSGGPYAGGVDAYLRKYISKSGVMLWSQEFGTSGSDAASGVAVAAEGGVDYAYVVGVTDGALPTQDNIGKRDAFVRKSNSDKHIWFRQFGTTEDDWASGVAVDKGNIYVVGHTGGILDLSDPLAWEGGAYLRKYDSNGTPRWTRQFFSTDTDEALGVAIDGAGDIYVVGKERTRQAYVRKYNSDGAEQWTRVFGSVAGSASQATGVAALGGNVYVVGNTIGGLSGSSLGTAYVRNYNSSGKELWTDEFRFGTGIFDVTASGVAVTSTNVYVVGKVPIPGGTGPGGSTTDPYVRKYDSLGTKQWTRQFGSFGAGKGIPVSTDAATGVAALGGDVYVVGYTDATFGTPPRPFDAFVLKLAGWAASAATPVRWVP